MDEKRRVKQIEIYDDNGNLEYTMIPNYKEHENFMTQNELRFYKFLINVVIELKEKYNLRLTIFAQVALNRLIDVNNERRMNPLFDKISRKSIDFALLDESTNKIYCCIELDDRTHERDDRKERDILLDKVFKDNIKLIHIERQDYYDTNDIIQKILN